MAQYNLFGTGNSLFEAQGMPGALPIHDFPSNILYATPTEFGFLNPDGSITYFFGTGFEYDLEYGVTGPGTVTGFKHFRDGLYIDEVSGLNLPINAVWSTSIGLPGAFGRWFNQLGVLGGDDVIDARFRVNNAIINTTLDGNAGNDTIYSGAGNDVLSGGYGSDIIFGGAGNDIFTDEYDSGPNAPAGNDRFSGQDGNDRISGFDGDDTLSGGNGNDIITGGRGLDTINGNAGSDIMLAGDESAIEDTSSDSMNGGSGTDTVAVRGGWEDIVVTRTSTGFTLSDGLSTDILSSVERIAVDQGTYSWNATTLKWQKVNTVSGEQLVTGTAPLNGTSGADTITLTAATQSIAYGLGGDDTITGLSQNDLLFGGAGNDVLRGDSTTPGGFQSRSNDRLYGEAGNDTLLGGEGFDVLKGGSGLDTLNGGRGSDSLSGGSEADTFIFNYETNATFDRPEWGNDTITDFQLGLDKIVLNFIAVRAITPTLTQTADGLLLSTTPGGSTILFKGVSATGVTVDDLLLI
jgi:Ca2+-binding RTX toxin-like protein